MLVSPIQNSFRIHDISFFLYQNMKLMQYSCHMTCFNNLSNDVEFVYTLSRHHVDNNLVVSSSSIFIPQSIHSIPFPFFRLSCKRVHIYIFSFLFLILSHSLKGNNPVIYNSHCWKWKIRKAKNMLFCMVYFFLFFSFLRSTTSA